MDSDEATKRRSAEGKGWYLSLLALAGALGLCSCGPKVQPKPVYDGPTLTLPQLVEQINRNNQALPSLYARHSFEGEFVDPRSKKQRFLNGSGDLFLLKPRDLLFRAKKDPVGQIFKMGSDAERFWFVVTEGDEGMWWGHHRNAGKPCMTDMPVRPDLVGEVLGISDIPTNLVDPPFPTLRYNSDADAYMVLWNERAGDRWFVEKEIWYDRATLTPRLVLLFDRNGRILLRAYLKKHQAVEIKDKPRESWPKIATVYDLFFPQTKSTMKIELSDIALKTATGQPKPGMIRFPEDVEVPENKVVQIDADCEKK